MEGALKDGFIPSDSKIVPDKWNSCFRDLLSPTKDVQYAEIPVDTNADNNDAFNEAYQAIRTINNNKSVSGQLVVENAKRNSPGYISEKLKSSLVADDSVVAALVFEADSIRADTVNDRMQRCLEGTFGYECRFECRCENGESCSKTTGSCTNGCRVGYWGPGCQLTNNCFYNGQARNYTGTKSVTKSMHVCQRWDSQEPHRHSYRPHEFPEGFYPENFCRTTPDSAKPWCYTNERKNRWEHCNVNNCYCPPGRFGHDCAKECHCSVSQEACDSILGMCKSGCALGWEGYDCQKAVACPENTYGWDCSQQCHCQNPQHCDRFTGPTTACRCKEKYFNPPFCEPVTQPKIVYFGNNRVNPGQPTTFNCSVSAFPTPQQNDIQLRAPQGRRVSLVRSRRLDQYSYTRVNIFHVNFVNTGETYACVVTSTAGRTSHTILADLYELPRLNLPPVISPDGVEPTELTIEWSRWDFKNGDTGDPPILWYNVWLQERGQTTFERIGMVFDMFCGETCNYTITELRPNTEYKMYITSSRDGEGGDGPPGQLLYARTDCGVPSSPVTIKSVVGQHQFNSSHPKARLVIKWEDPPRNTWNCVSIERYQIQVYGTHYDVSPRVVHLASDTPKFLSVPDLEPFTEYCVKITFQNNKGLDSKASNPVCATTPETVPTAPRNLKLTERSSESLTFAWDQPRSPRRNMTVYRLVFWKASTKELSTKKGIEWRSAAKHVEYILSGLEPHTKYHIQVQAVNKAGAGRMSEILTGETEESVPGPIRTFRNTTRSPDSIQFKWEPPETVNGELLFFLVSCYDVDATTIKHITERVPDNVFEYRLKELTPATKYNCSVNASTSKGSGPMHDIIVWTEAAELREPFPPIITDRTDTTVILELKAMDDPNVGYYRILVERAIERRRRRIPDAFQDVTLDFHSATEDGANIYVSAELTEIADDPFVVGDNKTYNGFFNAPLSPEDTYDIWFGAFSEVDGVLRKSFSKAEQSVVARTVAEAPPSNHVPVIVAVLVVFILLVLVFALLLFIWRRRHLVAEREKAEMPNFGPTIIPDPDPTPPSTPIDNLEVPLIETGLHGHGLTLVIPPPEPIPDDTDVKIPPIRVEDLWDYVKQSKTNDSELLKREYRLIPAGLTATCDVAKKTENKNKNRYGNIIAYDHTRVVLEPVEGDVHDDYTNANYIEGYQIPKAYIAAQGPTKPTISDIWRMVWQEKSITLIMLTNPTETGRKKCEQYWPESGSETYAGIKVKLDGVEELPDFTIRTFILTKRDESRSMKQFHYTTWPDHGVPRFGNSLLLFRQKIRSHDNLENGPVIVHCSAGVGRTGTYIAIDTQLEKAKTEGIIDVHNFVQLMRTQRVNMVQTLEQYIFVYDVLLEALICGDTTIPCDLYPEVLSELCQFDQSIDKTKLEEQFEILRLISSTIEKDESTTALRPENIFKNRCKNIIPANRCRPYLTSPSEEGNDYVNAVFVNGYRQRDAFIVTQMPLPNTVEDFWRLVYDHQSSCIIMLNDIEPKDETCEQYWTLDTCGENYEPFIVETTAEIKSDPSITVRDFTITNTQNPQESPRIVRQFQFHRWPENSLVPSSKVALLELLDMVDKWQQHTGNKSVTVHCMNGASRSGIFVSISLVIERIKAEKEVDVFQAVKQMRLNRPHLIDCMEQYRFCHEIVLDYLAANSSLRTFST
ncbi:hypothetical protein ScPMuIL_000966 [Solemya velum]